MFLYTDLWQTWAQWAAFQVQICAFVPANSRPAQKGTEDGYQVVVPSSLLKLLLIHVDVCSYVNPIVTNQVLVQDLDFLCLVALPWRVTRDYLWQCSAALMLRFADLMNNCTCIFNTWLCWIKDAIHFTHQCLLSSKCNSKTNFHAISLDLFQSS